MSAQVQAALASLPPVTRGLLVTLSAGYLLQLVVPSLRNHLGLSVGQVVTRPWTLITSPLVVDSIVQLAAFLPAVAALGRVVESQLGHVELLKTLGCAFLGAGFSVLFGVTTVYALQTRSNAVDEAGNILYQPALSFFPGIAALLVGLRMGAPETEMTLFSKFSFGVKVLPGAYLLLSAVLGLIVGRFVQLVSSVLGGLYWSWFYLRFFLPQPHGGRGMLGDDLGFAALFPSALVPLAERLATAAANATGLRPQEPSVTAIQGIGLGGALLPGSGAADAARRRERGQKALEERLGLTEAGRPSGSASSKTLLRSDSLSSSGGSAARSQHQQKTPAGESVTGGQ